MLRNLRINIVRQLVETAEGLFFNPKLLRLYRQLFGNRLKVAIDVGVNCGQTIDILLKVNPDCTIYGFEPNPKLFKDLQAKYAGKENIHLFRMGISAENGQKTFHENVLHSTSSLEELDYNSTYLKKKSKVLGVSPEGIIASSYTIQVIRLSDFIAEHIGSEKIDLLKIDTEGHEYYCLEGLFNGDNSNPPAYIQLESHNDDMYKGKRSFAEIEDLLGKHQYQMKEKIKHAFGDFDEIFYENTKV
jgi:FkbM family methyltransferase